jgi:negative regulator of replication initiation
MRKISVSDEVWQAIAARGKFGESEDDVLRRVFEIPAAPIPAARQSGPPGRGTRRFAQKSMSAKVSNGMLRVRFEDGIEKTWSLPPRSDKAAIKKLRGEAVDFAQKNGASNPGQTNAVRKAFTDAGYHTTK